MHPSETAQGNHFKDTGLTGVAGEEVAEIERTQQADVRGLDESLRRQYGFLVGKTIQGTLGCQTEYRSKVSAEAKAGISSQALELRGIFPTLIRQRRSRGHSGINTEIPVIGTLVTCQHSVLCRNICCHHCGSNHHQNLFHILLFNLSFMDKKRCKGT